MRMDHPFILGFCQNLIFHTVFTIIFSIFWAKPTFFNYCLISIVLCISDSNMGDPKLLLFQIELLFQNKNLCLWCVPRRVFVLLFFTCPGSQNVICGHFGTTFLKNVDILADLASNILPEGLLFKPEGLLSNLEYVFVFE